MFLDFYSGVFNLKATSKKLTALILVLLLAIMLGACGKEPSLDELQYKSKLMETTTETTVEEDEEEEEEETTEPDDEEDEEDEETETTVATVPVTPGTVGLPDMTIVDGEDDLEIKNEIVTDLLNNTYNPGNLCHLNNQAYDDEYVIIYLNNKYTNLSGTIINADDYDESCELHIYGSNDETSNTKTSLFSKKFYKISEPKKVSLDISKYKYLMLQTDGMFYLYNFEFKEK